MKKRILSWTFPAGALGLALAAALFGAASPEKPMVSEQGQGLLAHLVQAGAEPFQDLGGDGLPFLHQAEEEVLGPDVVVAQLPGLLDGQLQDPLGLRGEGDLPEREGLGETGEGPLHFRLDRLEAKAQALEDRRGDPLTVPDESQEDVLGPDEIVAEPPRLFPR